MGGLTAILLFFPTLAMAYGIAHILPEPVKDRVYKLIEGAD